MTCGGPRTRCATSRRRNGPGWAWTRPFDPYALASAHGIDVYTLAIFSEYQVSSDALAHFASSGSASWSAALVPFGTARIIIENQAHDLVRRRSNIAHELGHYLLEHPFDRAIFGEDHKRQFNEQQEKEAAFMAGELLIPLAATAQMAYQDWDNARWRAFIS